MRALYYLLLLFICLSFGLVACEKGGLSDGGVTPATEYFAAAPGVGNGDSTQQQTPGVLTSGEWNDHDNWSFWLNLMTNDTFATAQTAWGFNCERRWTFTITNQYGQPLPDVVVTILKGNDVRWECRTNRFGIARFVPVFERASDLAGMQYKLTYNGQAFSAVQLPAENSNISLSVTTAAKQQNVADIMFVVDATGSMGDEIIYLQNELYDVLNHAASGVGATQLRYASVFYRDHGDDFVTREQDFTNSVNTVTSFIKDQAASGGGDFPEAVEEALAKATQQRWSDNAKARVMFLILDAPPHSEADVINRVHDEIKEAAAKGILIIPVAASGIDKSTEFLLRFMAIATNGTYTFLTNDSGVGDAHLTPTVGPYNVEFLNQQIMRLIIKYAGQ